MKIYTKTGDDGFTGLLGGPRIRKDALRIEAYGTVDELNAALGLARALGLDEPLDSVAHRVSNELFDLGAELATPDPAQAAAWSIDAAAIADLEADIDRLEATLEPLAQFILPGGTAAAAAMHVARTVCRRAERRVISLADDPQQQVSKAVVVYLNRLSDLLFVMARAANAAAHCPDVVWLRRR